MGRITSGVGLVSGLNTADIIDQLMALEEAPKRQLQARIEQGTLRRTALLDIQTRLTSLRLYASTIKKTQTFRRATANSSNESVLTATANTGASIGSFKLRVARLVSTQQTVGKGFSDYDRTAVGAGTITVELGGGEVNTATRLDELNGGRGVSRGSFRITDRSGRYSVIDVSDAITLDDVVRKINTNLDVTVRASIDGDKLVLNDQSNGSGNLIVEEIGTGQTAGDLGIRQSVAGSTLTGSNIRTAEVTTKLSMLNDGRGVGIKAGQADLQINLADGDNVAVNLDGATTIQDVLDKIRAATGNRLSINLRADKRGFEVIDTSVDYNDPGNIQQTFSITSLNGSTAAKDLGLTAASAGDTITGSAFLAEANTVLLSSLKGGSGITLGTIRVTDRSGAQVDLNLANAESVQDIIDAVNNAGLTAKARLKASGNGIEIYDDSTLGGDLEIEDVVGTTADQLGIGGAFTTGNVSRGANLQRQWFTRGTLLKDLAGGKGIPQGKFSITNSAGVSATIDLTQGDETTVGKVIDEINAKNIGVTASINANGDGILLTDSAGGTQKLTVKDLNNGTTAKALNLAGTASGTTIDGSYEKTIEISATDKLTNVQTKINDLGWGVSASIINDGSGAASYRLSLTGLNGGRAGRLVIDEGAVDLGLRTIASADDAVVFYGGDGTLQPVAFTSSSNTINGIVPGVNIRLTGVSSEPVTVNVSRDIESVVESTQKFADDFNSLVEQINLLTKFDSTTGERGLLLGEASVQQIQTELYGVFTTSITSTGNFRTAGDIGLRVGPGGKLEFDSDKFREAWASNPDDVMRLFAESSNALTETTRLATLRNGQGIRTVSGADFRISLRDGTGFDVDLGDATDIGDVITAINNASNGKLTASIASDGTKLRLIDNTTGTKKLTVSSLNGSVTALDLGISGIASSNVMEGRRLVNVNAGDRGGIGSVIEKRINRLIDPASGVVTRASKDIDSRNEQFLSRIESLDKQIAAKRSRLQRQFAALEGTLAKLQGQSSALANFQIILPQSK